VAGGRTLIVGYGNPLRSDDGFGWHAARLLEGSLAALNVEVVTCHQLMPELAERLSQADCAVFIDADSRGTPGAIHRRTVRPQPAGSAAFTHTCSPAALLLSAEQLYGRRPQALAITVSAQSFEFGESLSPVVAQALPAVVEMVRKAASNVPTRRVEGEERADGKKYSS
jgi:hydrogenase maturation protease